MISPPSWLFKFVISSFRSPVAISVFGHSDLVSDLVKTIFGVFIIFLANVYQESSGFFTKLDQVVIKSSVIFLPKRIVSTGSCNLYSYSRNFSSQVKSIQSISLLGPAIQPSMDIPTCSFNFLIALLLSLIYFPYQNS